MSEWRWPIGEIVVRGYKGYIRWLRTTARYSVRDEDLWGAWLAVSIMWALLISLVAIILSAIWWTVGLDQSIQFYGHHPRPGFWILVGAAVPLALVLLWGVVAWVLPVVLRVLWLFVPRPRR